MRRIVGTFPLLSLMIGLSTSAYSEDTAPAPQEGSEALYMVENGTQVDEQTLNGWKTWRALACERCHGAAQEGMVGPSLLESIKRLSKDEFHTIMMTGRIEKGMPPFNTSQMMQKNWEGLYAYLQGRSDGKIEPGRLTAIGK